jgi:ubiquinone/menaquinone biosynthesis C-methylase UbiE
LNKAYKAFKNKGFKQAEFYVTTVNSLPFIDNVFSVCLCILSLNFFNDIEQVFKEIKRVLVPGGFFMCCVPVPERKTENTIIRGTLYTEEELKIICKNKSFEFQSLPYKNGALLYFKAFKI